MYYFLSGWCRLCCHWLFQGFMSWNGFFIVNNHFIFTLFFGFGWVLSFLFFAGLPNIPVVTAALSIAGGASAGAGAGVTATAVSFAISVAVSVPVDLDSLLLLHADARTRIPHEIIKNFAFIFFNLGVSVF